MLRAEVQMLACAKRHDFRPRGGARRVQDERDVIRLRRRSRALRRGRDRVDDAREPERARAGLRLRRERDERDAELLRGAKRGRLAARFDDQRLRLEIFEVELELVLR